MSNLPRRLFLGTSLAGLAMGLAPHIFNGDEKQASDNKPVPPKDKWMGKHPWGHDSLFLTWWTDPTTTMVAQWIGPEACEHMEFRYAPAKSDEVLTAPVTKHPFPDTDLYVHRCELTGLTPGREYKFHISDNPKTYWFRTMPAKATDTIQFVSGGDCGTGSHALASNVLAARQEPYFALLGGDLAYDNGVSPATFLAFLRNYSQTMRDPKGRMVPMISCLGNHEVNGSYHRKRKDAPHYLSVFDGFYRDATYNVLDIGDYLSIVLLDSGHIAPIKGAQTDWLAQTLVERQERPHLLVANHVPAYPSHRAPENKDGSPGTGADNRRYWSPLFENYGVDGVLEHHDHTFKRTHPLTAGLKDKNGVLYLGDGSWGRIRALEKPESRPYLATYASAYHISVHRLEGDQRYHIALEENGRVADICTTTGKRPSRRA